MPTTPGSKSALVEGTLTDWQRKAVDMLLIASTLMYLPVLLIQVFGPGIPFSGWAQIVAVVTYVSIVVGAVSRRLDYRKRAWVVLGLCYVLSITGTIAFPEGPFVRILPVWIPIFLLVLNGEKAARIGTGLSVVILMVVPFASDVPELTRIFRAGSVNFPTSIGIKLVQGLALSGVLVATMLLLRRFESFLVMSLTAEQEASLRLKAEAEKLGTAHQELCRQMDERRRLEHEIARIGDDERRRLGQDVHDGVCQQLTGALLRCKALERRVEQGGPVAQQDLRALYSLLEEAMDEAHAVARGLCPLDTDPEALESALRTLTKRAKAATAVLCEFVADGDVRVYDPTAAQHLYRIAQEALSNAVRHSRANRIVLELQGSERSLVLRIRDDGIGLSSDLSSGGMGLRNMAYRARVLEGKLEVENDSKGGAVVTCVLPRRNSRPENPLPGIEEELNNGRYELDNADADPHTYR